MIINTNKSDIVWNYLGIITSLGSQVILLPILIKFLEPDILGLWYIFVSIGSLVLLFDFGFNPTIARTVSYCWSGAKSLNKIDVEYIEKDSNTNYELLYYVIKTCKILYLVIAIVALFFMLTVGTYYINTIAKGIFNGNIILSWTIYMLSIFLNLYIGYYSVALRGIGDISNLNKANIISKIFFLVFAFGGLILGGNILALSIASLVSGCILRCISAYIFYNKHKMKYIFKNISFSDKYNLKYVFQIMWHNAWRDGIVSVNGYLTIQASTLICASFFSLSETGIYSFCLQVITAISNIASGLYISYQPSLQSAYINKNKLLLLKLYSKSISIFYLFFLSASIIFLLIGIPIVYFIKESFYIDKVTYILLAINIFLLQRHRLSASFISNMNKLPYVKSFIFFGILGIVFSYIYIRFFDGNINSMIIVSIIIQSMYNNWKWNNYVNNYLKVNEFILLRIGYKEIKLFEYLKEKLPRLKG